MPTSLAAISLWLRKGACCSELASSCEIWAVSHPFDDEITREGDERDHSLLKEE